MKHVIITGGHSRIGDHLTEYLTQNGYAVTLFDLVKTEDRLPNQNVRSFFCDLEQFGTFEDVIEQVLAETRLPIMHLVNLARSGRNSGLLKKYSKTEEQEWIREFHIQTMAPYFMTLAIMEKNPDRKSLRSVVNVSSVLSDEVSESESAAYHASKAALDSVTRVLAVGLGDWEIRVNSVRPGFLEDKSRRDSRDASHLNGRLNQTRIGSQILRTLDLCRTIEFLLSDMSSGISGQCITVDRAFSTREQLDAIMRIRET